MIDLDVDSFYPHTMNWFSNFKNKPRICELRIREEPATQKYTVYISGGDWWEDKEVMNEWCSKNFGHRNEGYNNPRWSQGPFEFRFKNEKDAMFFMLKWG
jgi:hypothetical protein